LTKTEFSGNLFLFSIINLCARSSARIEHQLAELVATGSNPVVRIKKIHLVDFFNCRTKSFVRQKDLNAGAMFGELAGEPNREAVVSPSRRKTARGAT
jgi:hypothetical protein